VIVITVPDEEWDVLGATFIHPFPFFFLPPFLRFPAPALGRFRPTYGDCFAFDMILEDPAQVHLLGLFFSLSFLFLPPLLEGRRDIDGRFSQNSLVMFYVIQSRWGASSPWPLALRPPPFFLPPLLFPIENSPAKVTVLFLLGKWTGEKIYEAAHPGCRTVSQLFPCIFPPFFFPFFFRVPLTSPPFPLFQAEKKYLVGRLWQSLVAPLMILPLTLLFFFSPWCHRQ